MKEKLGYSIALEFWRRNSAAMDRLYAEEEDIPQKLRDIYEQNTGMIDRIIECAEQDAKELFDAAKSEIERVAKSCGLATKRRRNQTGYWLGAVYIARSRRSPAGKNLILGVLIETIAENGDFDVAVYLAFPGGFNVDDTLLRKIRYAFPQACLDGTHEVLVPGSISLATLKLSQFVDSARKATDLDALLQAIVCVLQQVQNCSLLPWALDRRDGKPGPLKMPRPASAGK